MHWPMSNSVRKWRMPKIYCVLLNILGKHLPADKKYQILIASIDQSQ